MKQLNKNFIWNAVGNTAYDGLQWFITVIVARSSGLNNAGVLAIAMSFSLIFRTISYFGIRDFQVSDENNKYSFADYTGLRIITCILSLAACMIFAALSRYAPNVLTAIFWYMIFRISEGFSDLFHGAIQKKDRLDISGVCLTLKAVITTIAFALVFLVMSSLNYALAAMALSAVTVNLLIELPLTVKICSLKAKVRWIECGKLAVETAPLLLHLFLTSVILNMPKYALSIAYNEVYLGAYSSIFSVSQILQGAFQYIYTPFITKFSKLYRCKMIEKIEQLSKRIIFIFLLLMILFTLIMQICGTHLLVLIFGEEIKQYKDLIFPSIISVCAYSIMFFICTLKTIMRHFRIMILGQTAGLLAGIICTYFFIKLLGAGGASYGVAAASAVSSVIVLGSSIFDQHFLTL